VDMIFDGEVIAGSFNDTVSNVRKKSVQAANSELFIFHYALYEDFLADNDTRTMGQIKSEMQKIKTEIDEDSPIKIHPYYFANSEEEILQMYAKVREKNGEGIIVKARDSKYTNRRNHAWMKVKNNSTIDVKVVDWEEGTGEIKGMLGALVVDVDGVKVNVGSGFSRQQRMDFWDNIEDLEDQLVEVSYHEKTPAGSLRHPVFESVRYDKSEANTVS
jgi:DNA ligase-1